MKKILYTVVALALMIGLVAVFTACGSEATTTEPDVTTTVPDVTTTQPTVTTTQPVVTTTAPAEDEPSVPEGYQLYENDAISFAYPENWLKQDGSVTILVNEDGVGNNISITYEEKSDAYAEMTAAVFEETMEQMTGLTLSNTTVAQLRNGNDLAITKIAYTLSASGVSMAQTMYVTAVGELNYIITVTEVTSDAKLVQTVFDTLNVVK